MLMKKTFFFLLVFALTLSMTGRVSALTVSPTKIEITADPGQTVRGEIELFNEQKELKTFYASYENFESRGDSGAPYFIGAETNLATWISTDSTVTLEPGQHIQVPYTISIPQDAKPGGYFAAIFFGSQPSQGTGGGEVTIGGKIGILVLLKVAGDVKDSAGLVDFEATGDTRFFSTLPVALEYGFNNAGGDRVVPRGEIKIKNTFQFVSATLLANQNEGSVLPNSTRRFEVVWKEKNGSDKETGFFKTAFSQIKNFHFGWYRADMNVVWGESAQTMRASYHFFIIPWQLLSIVVIIIAAIWFVFKVWVKRFRQRILAEVMRNK